MSVTPIIDNIIWLKQYFKFHDFIKELGVDYKKLKKNQKNKVKEMINYSSQCLMACERCYGDKD